MKVTELLEGEVVPFPNKYDQLLAKFSELCKKLEETTSSIADVTVDLDTVSIFVNADFPEHFPTVKEIRPLIKPLITKVSREKSDRDNEIMAYHFTLKDELDDETERKLEAELDKKFVDRKYWGPKNS